MHRHDFNANKAGGKLFRHKEYMDLKLRPAGASEQENIKVTDLEGKVELVKGG